MCDHRPKILLIDNYDSFTFNLVQFLGELGADIVVRRNDALSCADAVAMDPAAIVLSPGPCRPDTAGICLDLVQAAAARAVPLLGVCLGHQSIGQAFGGRIVHCHEIVHGKTAQIHHNNSPPMRDLPSPFAATRYHSLVVEKESFPESLEVSAWTDDGTIMGLKHKELPVFGVQFHPESIATDHGHNILSQFLKVTAGAS